MDSEAIIKIILEKYISSLIDKDDIYESFLLIFKEEAEDQYINFIFDIEEEFDIVIEESDINKVFSMSSLLELIQYKKEIIYAST